MPPQIGVWFSYQTEQRWRLVLTYPPKKYYDCKHEPQDWSPLPGAAPESYHKRGLYLVIDIEYKTNYIKFIF